MENSKAVHGIIVRFSEMGGARGTKGAEKTLCAQCASGIWTIEKKQQGQEYLFCFCDLMKRTTWDGAGNERSILDCSGLSSLPAGSGEGFYDLSGLRESGSEVTAMSTPRPVQVSGMPEYRRNA